MKITIYTTATCPYCEMLMKYLDEKGLTYEKKLVDEDTEAKGEMMKLSDGFLGVPYTVIDKDGVVSKVIGFDRSKIDEILETK